MSATLLNIDNLFPSYKKEFAESTHKQYASKAVTFILPTFMFAYYIYL